MKPKKQCNFPGSLTLNRMGLCMHNTQSSYGLGCLTKYNTTVLLCLPWLQTLPTIAARQCPHDPRPTTLLPCHYLQAFKPNRVSQTELVRNLSLRVLSPTSFRHKKHYFPLPVSINCSGHSTSILGAIVPLTLSLSLAGG